MLSPVGGAGADFKWLCGVQCVSVLFVYICTEMVLALIKAREWGPRSLPTSPHPAHSSLSFLSLNTQPLSHSPYTVLIAHSSPPLRLCSPCCPTSILPTGSSQHSQDYSAHGVGVDRGSGVGPLQP